MRTIIVIALTAAVAIGLYAFFVNSYQAVSSKSKFMPYDTLIITSSAFVDGGAIPARFTCDGPQVSPALSFSGVPAEARSLVLIMDDPDVPKALKPDGVFDHWVLFNIDPSTSGIPEGGTAGTAGVNTAGKNAYRGPCPPKQYEPSEHRYLFTLYALDTLLPLQAGASKTAVLSAMRGHMLAQAQLLGRYKRP